MWKLSKSVVLHGAYNAAIFHHLMRDLLHERREGFEV
jgi:hypothetical protein